MSKKSNFPQTKVKNKEPSLLKIQIGLFGQRGQIELLLKRFLKKQEKQKLRLLNL